MLLLLLLLLLLFLAVEGFSKLALAVTERGWVGLFGVLLLLFAREGEADGESDGDEEGEEP